MATRAVIGYKNEDGTVTGTYNHGDGYPSHLLNEISALVERDGFARAASVLVQHANGWSFVDSQAVGDADAQVLEGYGRFYTDDETYPYTASIDDLVRDADAQWVYLFDMEDSVLEVFDVWGGMNSVVIVEDELADIDFDSLASEFTSPI